MDHQAMIRAMKTSISEVLEEMFFMPIDFIGSAADDAGIEDREEMVAARLDFKGPCSGHFLLISPKSLVDSITADFLGVSDQNVSDDQVYGTAMEMINMLAGNTLSQYDHRAVYDLEIPKLVTLEHTEVPDTGSLEYFDVHIETLACRMTLKLVVRPNGT